MIRKEVEKLRDMVLTPEELEGVILPLIIASKEKKNKPDHNYNKKTMRLLKHSYDSYSDFYGYYERMAKSYDILSNMAEYDPDKLLYIWNKILKTGELVYPKDIDKKTFFALYNVSSILVYDDCYEITSFENNVVKFEKMKDRLPIYIY